MKTAPEAVSFPMSHLSGQGNSFSSARAASGFALTVSISPPTLRGCMWPGLDRHRLIGFVGIVSHFPFASPLFRTFRAEQRSISI